jgi:hypothetical protein
MKNITARISKFAGLLAVFAVVFAVVLGVNHFVSGLLHTGGVVVGMALTANLTQAWKSRIEAYLQKAPIYLQAITNKHYEGDIKQNATLNIVSVGEISVGTYTGADISFDTMATTGITFTADQKKYFGFQVLDTDMIGSMLNLMDSGSQKAAQAMARDVDSYIAGLYTQITSNVYGTDGAPITVGFDSVAGDVLPSVALATLMQKMAEANADQSNPKTVVPPWFASYLLMEFGRRFTPEGDSAGKAGVNIGKLDLPPTAGFSEIWVSNNVPNTAGTLYKVMAGTPDSSVTFGMALEKVETGRLQQNFGSFVKGINVYGGKIPFEAHMALGTFNVGTPRQS